MRDWAGTAVQRDALTVGCRYCLAAVGERCRAKVDGKPLVAFPAHTVRIRDAARAAGLGRSA